MSDTVEILASASQPNITYTRSGRDGTSGSHVLQGVRGGDIPINVWPSSTPVDVTPYSTLRTTLSVTNMVNRHGDEEGIINAAKLYVELDHGPAANGPWKLLHRFKPMNHRGEQRAVLSGFDNFIRARWYFRRGGSDEAMILDQVAFTFGLTALAEPEQPEEES